MCIGVCRVCACKRWLYGKTHCSECRDEAIVALKPRKNFGVIKLNKEVDRSVRLCQSLTATRTEHFRVVRGWYR